MRRVTDLTREGHIILSEGLIKEVQRQVYIGIVFRTGVVR